MRKFIFIAMIFIFCFKAMAASLEVAITIDDLPVHGDLPSGVTRLDVAKQIIATLNKHSIKNVYGFINAGRINKSDDTYTCKKGRETFVNILT